MSMIFLLSCSVVHVAAAATVVVTGPAVLHSGDAGAVLFWSAGTVGVLLGTRAALAIQVAAAARVFALLGLRTHALRTAALRISPLALRAALAAALAGGMGLSTVAGTAHAASDAAHAAHASAASVPLIWPIAPDLDSPAHTGPPPDSDPIGSSGTITTHLVAEGESLWSIAATAEAATARTGSEQTAAPTDRIARRVQEIHAANREVIGPDPSLILPGQRLELS